MSPGCQRCKLGVSSSFSDAEFRINSRKTACSSNEVSLLINSLQTASSLHLDIKSADVYCKHIVLKTLCINKTDFFFLRLHKEITYTWCLVFLHKAISCMESEKNCWKLRINYCKDFFLLKHIKHVIIPKGAFFWTSYRVSAPQTTGPNFFL